MNKRLLTTALIASSIAITPTFASSLTQKLIGLKLRIHAASAPKTKLSAENQAYTNFAGTWTGHCPADGEPQSFTIYQTDENSIYIEGEPYSIGDLKTESNSNNTGQTNFEHVALSWTEDKSSLMLKGVFVLKDKNDPLLTFLAEASLSLVNDQLVVNNRWVAFSGLNQSEQDALSCTFEKAAPADTARITR